MKYWQATIKEIGNDHLLTPKLYNEDATRQYCIKFWGLNEPDIEWYTLEQCDDEND